MPHNLLHTSKNTIKRTFRKLKKKISSHPFNTVDIVVFVGIILLFTALYLSFRSIQGSPDETAQRSTADPPARVEPSVVTPSPTEEETKNSFQMKPLVSQDEQGHSPRTIENIHLVTMPVGKEPSVLFSGVQDKDITIKVYSATEQALIQHLSYEPLNEDDLYSTPVVAGQIPDEDQLTLRDEFVHHGQNKTDRVLLPLTDPDMYYITATHADHTENLFFIYTNIGVMAKKTADSTLFWGQYLDTKKRLTGGQLSVHTVQKDQYQQLFSGSINENGLAFAPLSPQTDIAIAQVDSSYALIPLDIYYMRYNYRSKRYFQQVDWLDSYVFTDRPIYKPGDKIYVKAIVRTYDGNKYTLPSGTVYAYLSRGYGDDDIVEKKVMSLQANGSIDGRFVLPEDAKTGTYYIMFSEDDYDAEENFNRPRYLSQIGSTQFEVEYYRKPEYFLDLQIDENVYLPNNEMTATVQGSYFSGQPLTGVEIDYTLTERYDSASMDSGSLTLDENGQATITHTVSRLRGERKTISITASYTDQTGNPARASANILVYPGTYSLDLVDRPYGVRPGKPVELTIEASPNTDDAQIAGRTLTVDIQRREWVRSQSSKESILEYYQGPIDEITTDAEGRATYAFTPQNTGSYVIHVEGYDEYDNTIKNTFHVYSSDRGWYIDSERYEKNKHEFQEPLTIHVDKSEYLPGEAATVSVSSANSGGDVLVTTERAYVNAWDVVRVDEDVIQTQIPIQETDMPRTRLHVLEFESSSLQEDKAYVDVSTNSKKIQVEVAPRRETYGPGDTAQVDIRTTDLNGNPVSAEVTFWAVDKALFQLAQERSQEITEGFWVNKNYSSQTAHSFEHLFRNFPGGMGGGCFDPKTRISMADGSEKPISEVAAGDMIVTRTSEEHARLISARVSSVHATEVPGYLILNHTLRVTPDHVIWLNNTWQTASQAKQGDILTDQEGRSVPITSVEWVGGEQTVYNIEVDQYHTFFADGVWVHNSKGEPRTVFADTAYWNPGVQTDVSGYASVQFPLPDNLTTWSLAGVAANSQTQVGQGNDEIVVTQDVIIRTVLPNVLRAGDTMKISALVHNHTDAAQPFDIEIASDDLTIQKNNTRTVSISPGSIEELFWDVRPKQASGEATIGYRASSEDNEEVGDEIYQTVPIEEYSFESVTSQAGRGNKEYEVSLYDDGDKTDSTATLSLSVSLLGTLPSAMDYLLQYPYGCVEQTTSRFVPLVIVKQNPTVFQNIAAEKPLDEMILKGISKLNQLQNANGSWSWWNGTDTDMFISAYVLEYLIQARNAGVEFDSEIIDRATTYFEGEFRDISPESTIYMAYARSLYDSEKKKIIKASDLKKDIPPDAVAMAVMANIRNGITDPEENGTNILLSMAKEDYRGLYWEESDQEGQFPSVEKSTALAVRALLSPRVVTGSSLDAAEKGIAYLQDSRTRQYWRNTYATAQIIQVFTDYANKKTEEPSDVSYVVTLNDKEFEKGVLSSEDNDYIEIPLPRTHLTLSDSTKITVTTDNNANQLRSVLTVRDSISDVEYKGKDAGIKIKRYYTTESGWKEKDTIHVGDLVVVHLDLDLHKNTTGQAVIADTLPAGLIPVNTKLDNENEKVSKYGLFDRYMEYLPDGVIIPIDNLTKGKHSYYYYARAITEGTYQTPPAQTEMMYQPEIYGHTESARVSVYASQVDQESQSSSGNTNIDPTIQHLQEVNDEQEEARNTLEDDISELSEENKELKEQIGLVQTMQYGLLALVIGLPVGVGAYIHRKKIVRYGKKGLKKVKPLWSKLKSIFERIGKRG